MVHQKQFTLRTRGHGDMHDLTDEAARIVPQSGVQTGTVNVFHLGSTGAVGAIEFEPGLKKDLPQTLDRLIPPGTHYAHEQTWHDGNGHSHLQGDAAWPLADGAGTGRQTGAGDMAADHPAGVRRSAAREDHCGNGAGRVEEFPRVAARLPGTLHRFQGEWDRLTFFPQMTPP